ncbi:hypothetical protein V6N11_058416 [Hibiscus sabdariffa]|uniref:Uncharacterized protein n=1 Tax=Hibiscus sabdariffa TaxID=183260 RepID=A0ABR2U468_9ROSI
MWPSEGPPVGRGVWPLAPALSLVVGIYFVGVSGNPCSLRLGQLPAFLPAAGVLLVAACGAGLLPSWEFNLRFVHPLIGLRIAALVGIVWKGFCAITYFSMSATPWPQPLWPSLHAIALVDTAWKGSHTPTGFRLGVAPALASVPWIALVQTFLRSNAAPLCINGLLDIAARAHPGCFLCASPRTKGHAPRSLLHAPMHTLALTHLCALAFTGLWPRMAPFFTSTARPDGGLRHATRSVAFPVAGLCSRTVPGLTRMTRPVGGLRCATSCLYLLLVAGLCSQTVALLASLSL